MNKSRGKRFSGSLKLNPKVKHIKNKIDPPIAHFRPVMKNISLLLLRNLLKLMSMLQNKHAETTKRLPVKFWLKERFWRLLVLKKIAPISKRANPRTSFFLANSLRKKMPMRIIKRISTLDRRAAFTAVIWLRPFKYNAGAITAPKIAVKNRVK
jgi:hypothetical protein